MTTVISVENLSKTYRLGQIGTGTFSRDLEVWWAKMRGKPNPMLRIGEKDHGNRDGEELWALKDVSFTVQQGEVLGIIGRNGAGKSTLLKILSRVTAPTSGRIRVKGRIASLLEVGTGFHPELTGRENIFLNGAILGMKRDEITRKFDEIVDFAEVEKFIDTPVKRYSSGMYVRLAFAVAAHLEPEILVVDEVLAVGDAAFQKKCLGKMGDVAKEGRTVLFVSHNMAAITMLCNLCLLIHNGKMGEYGKTSTVVHSYVNLNKDPEASFSNFGIGNFYNLKLNKEDDTKNSPINISSELILKYDITSYKLFLIIQDDSSNFIVHSVVTNQELTQIIKKGVNRISIELPMLWLKPGNYSVQIKLVADLGKKMRIISPSMPLEVTYYVDSENLIGLLNPTVRWQIT
jgi:lipopolysaccharide transport system ATP-binding protein